MHAPNPDRIEKCRRVGPAVSIVATSLDSHVVDCGSCPGPGGLKLMPGVCACLPKIREENGGEGIVVWPSPLGSDFSLSVSLSLSGKHTHPIAKTSPKEKIIILVKD